MDIFGKNYKKIEQNTCNIDKIISNLLSNQPKIYDINLSLSYTDIKTSPSALVSTLIATGYIAPIERVNIGEYLINFPNEEIKWLFKKEIADRFLKSKNAQMFLYTLRESLKDCNTLNIESLIEKQLLSSFSYYDFSDERNYHIFTLTLCSLLFEDFVVNSEVNSGTGRCDIMIYSKKQELGIVIEIKHSKTTLSKERLETLAFNALKQIKNNDYIETLSRQNQKHIIIYGFGFSGKRVSLKSEIIM